MNAEPKAIPCDIVYGVPKKRLPLRMPFDYAGCKARFRFRANEVAKVYLCQRDRIAECWMEAIDDGRCWDCHLIGENVRPWNFQEKGVAEVAAPSFVFIDRHTPRKGDVLWAFVGKVPTQIRFDRLLPYNGFSILGEGDYPIEVFDDAFFAPTKADLIAAQRAKWRADIARLERKIIGLQQHRTK